MGRISRDEMFMEIAKVVSRRGTCDRAYVGAILVNPDNNIVSIGYNGAPPGKSHCSDVGHVMYNNHCIRTIHAEENCVTRFNPTEGSSKKYTMYVTHKPCIKCISVIHEFCDNNNIMIDVIYDEDYGTSEKLSQHLPLISLIQMGKLQGDSYE